MRKSPAYPLQKAVYEALAGAGLTNVTYSVDAKTPLPWVVIGDDQIISDYDSADFYDCHVTVHIFAERMPQAKLVGGQVADALDIPLVVEGFQTSEFMKVSERYMNENGGTNAHAIFEFMFKLQAI